METEIEDAMNKYYLAKRRLLSLLDALSTSQDECQCKHPETINFIEPGQFNDEISKRCLVCGGDICNPPL